MATLYGASEMVVFHCVIAGFSIIINDVYVIVDIYPKICAILLNTFWCKLQELFFMLHQLTCINSTGLEMVDSVPFKLIYFSSCVRRFHRSLSVCICCNTPEIQAATVTSLT